jgi:hypothetical protein
MRFIKWDFSCAVYAVNQNDLRLLREAGLIDSQNVPITLKKANGHPYASDKHEHDLWVERAYNCLVNKQARNAYDAEYTRLSTIAAEENPNCRFAQSRAFNPPSIPPGVITTGACSNLRYFLDENSKWHEWSKSSIVLE